MQIISLYVVSYWAFLAALPLAALALFSRRARRPLAWLLFGWLLILITSK